jgi:hypothetical protein
LACVQGNERNLTRSLSKHIVSLKRCVGYAPLATLTLHYVPCTTPVTFSLFRLFKIALNLTHRKSLLSKPSPSGQKKTHLKKMRWWDRAHHEDTKADAVVMKDKLISTFVFILSCLAWSCAMFVPVWKVVDTSYLFRVSALYRFELLIFFSIPLHCINLTKTTTTDGDINSLS